MRSFYFDSATLYISPYSTEISKLEQYSLIRDKRIKDGLDLPIWDAPRILLQGIPWQQFGGVLGWLGRENRTKNLELGAPIADASSDCANTRLK